jgi:hypothetical protein
MNEQTGPGGSGMPAPARPSSGPDALARVSALRAPFPERVVNVEIGELILDGFGPADLRPARARRVPTARAGSAHAAEAFRRELARQLSVAGPAAEQLAGTIADAVFRQLSEPPPRGGAR